MKTIQAALHPTDGYINSFKRNTVEGWWEIEVGLPISWVFDENNKIKCEVLAETEVGKLVRISPKTDKIVIDDLILFVEIIIDTNQRIAKKEKEFTDSLEKKKKELEVWASGFYKEMDELKETSFKKVGENFVKTLQPEKKPRKPRTPKPKSETTQEPDLTQFKSPGVSFQEKDSSDLLELDTSEEIKK